MSTLKVNTLQDASGGNSIAMSAMTSLAGINANAVAKAWVNFNQTGTQAIRNSFNVSSVTDNGSGNTTVNYTNALPSANDAAFAWGMRSTGSDSNYLTWRRSTPNVNNINVRNAYNWASGGVANDLQYYYVVVFSA